MLPPLTATTPERLLMGSGPSPVPPRVLEALARPTIGHLDPAFVEVMEETCAALREVFVTSNTATFPLSATGGGGMDALVTNFVAPGDRVVLAVCGLFGERLSDALGRAGAEVGPGRGRVGEGDPSERLIEAAEPGLDALVVVHGETSTGVCQPLEGLAEVVRERDALLLMDCVTSLSGQRLSIDEAGVDAAFSGSQKCLNCPPGLAPFTAGERALAKLERAGEPPRSWYFDVSMLRAFWVPDGARAYHHTVPDQHGLRAAAGARARDRGGPRGALGAPRASPRGAPLRRSRYSGWSGSRPTASSSTRCWPCACPSRWLTKRPSARSCSPNTGSRSRAASARSPGRSGGSV